MSLAVTAVAGVLGAGVQMPAQAAKPAAELQLPAGARVGVVSVLDAEVTHFHAAKPVQSSFLKTYTVSWQPGVMLEQTLREPLTQQGITVVPLAAPETLRRLREECFLDANLAKGLSKECAAPYAQLAASERLAALIVLGPGLNNTQHAGGSRHKELPEYLRGFCVVTGAEGAVAPVLLTLTELLLITVTPTGVVLADREWGGAFTQSWTGFAAPADLRSLPDAQLDQLQPLYAALLGAQAGALLGHLQGTR